ncbi:ribonuclease J [Patescibacteria group bacterium]|nr:ribonuclease J [Patescibacteria group bacterium]
MLRFIALSGTTGVTENLYVYEHLPAGRQATTDMMIVDCGVGFPDLEMQGVDLVIPDFSYIIQNKHKLRGILISQGHEDHMGALPFLLDKVRTEIWAPKLVELLLKDKFKDRGVGNVRINTFDPEGSSFKIGPFTIHPFNVAHSIPDAMGFAIDTSEGRTFHVPEHKFDAEPVVNKPFDIEKAKRLAGENVLFLASDCLGANKPGFTPGEKDIEKNLLPIVQNSKGRVFFTAISSNIARFQQAINTAKQTGRKVAFVGRSVQKKSEFAHTLGYLEYSSQEVVPLRVAEKLPIDKIMYIIAGSYGQVGSSLYRLATDDHRQLQMEKRDTIIFSSDPAPPYTKESIDFIVDAFIEKGLDVHYYDLNEGLYVSGHGSQGDIVKLFEIVNPRYFIPIGGTIRFMHAYRKLAENFGAPPENIFELKPGDSLEFANGKVQKGAKVQAKEVLVDGLGIGDVGKIILQDRKTLGQYGVAVVTVRIDKSKKQIIDLPEIVSRGFVFEKEEQMFLKQSAKALKAKLSQLPKKDSKSVKFFTSDFLGKLFFKDTGRKPMVVPVVVEV